MDLVWNGLPDPSAVSRLANPLQILCSGRFEHVEGMSVLGERIHDFRAPAAVSLLAVPRVESHLEAAQAVERIFDLRAATEMQDETQMASATSSPDPLTLDGPQDRDIDVYHYLPSSADSCEA